MDGARGELDEGSEGEGHLLELALKAGIPCETPLGKGLTMS